jgi:hypothetical protein
MNIGLRSPPVRGRGLKLRTGSLAMGGLLALAEDLARNAGTGETPALRTHRPSHRSACLPWSSLCS